MSWTTSRGNFVTPRSVPPANHSAGDGEFAVIRRYFSGLGRGDGVRLGPGDDAAILAVPEDHELLVSSDTQLVDVHFPASTAPSDMAYRAVAAAASDLAAMGAAPLGMTLSLCIPRIDDNWLHGCREGLAAAVQDFALPLVGGDTVHGPLSLGITVLGCAPRGAAIRRSGARPGDRLMLSGPTGEAAAGLALIQEQLHAPDSLRSALQHRFLRPQPAFMLGQSLRGIATAAIDVSDGLLADARHLAEASGVSLHLSSSAIPLTEALLCVAGTEQALRWALAGGDDYVLIFTLPPDANLPAGCYPIGHVGEGSGILLDGTEAREAGYQHF